MKFKIHRCVVLLLSILMADVLLADETDRFMAVVNDDWRQTLKENPIAASREGVSEFNHLLPGVTESDRKRRASQTRKLLKRLDNIDALKLSEQDQINYRLLQWRLRDRMAEHELGTFRVPLNSFSSFFGGAMRASADIPMTQVEDYEAYIQRLGEFPRYFRENTENMRTGLKENFTLPKIIIEGVLPTVRAQVYEDPTSSSLYEPFSGFPDSIPDSQRDRLRRLGIKAIREAAIPAFLEFANFLEQEYLPETRESVGASELPNGQNYYAHQVQSYTTLDDVSPDEIHAIGLSEVARIKADMKAIIRDLKFEGSFDEFVQFLRTDPRFYATTADELLKEAAYIAKRIDLVMPGFFGKLPRLSYGVMPVPDEIAPNYTTAAYWGAAIGGTKGGTYVVNTYALDQRPLYELTALTLHEAVPGHHHQVALAQELENVPDFRRNFYLSAFGEGWALYTEKLGIEMDLYQTSYDHFGRLSYEMWRACRLVIDTGLHVKGWSRQQALDYLADNTSLSLANVRAEVDRYISWPGQALSYKMGELKIWELRRQAEDALGSKFDLREFHDAVLENGSVPLVLLEEQIADYIKRNL